MIEEHPSVFASGEISETKANQIEGIALCMVDSESARGKQCVIKQLRPRSPAAQHEYRRFGTCALRLALTGRLLLQNSRRWVHDGCSETGVLDHWDRIMLEFEVGHIRKMSGRSAHHHIQKNLTMCFTGENWTRSGHAALRRSLQKCYSTPAIAASTASTSAPRSLPLAAAPAPGEALAQPGPFSRQSLGSRLTPSFKSRMPAALSETAIVPEGQEPWSEIIKFFSNL